MSRRAGYLVTWGVVYVALSVLFSDSELPSLWQFHFAGAGVIAILGAITSWKWLDSLGFILLAMSSAAMGARYVFEILFGEAEPLSALGAVVWVGVAVAQVIVAGWPDTVRVTFEDTNGESDGGAN